eukprot:scaffold75375_cov65-Phaeocystis_antarctica.AAC.4
MKVYRGVANDFVEEEASTRTLVAHAMYVQRCTQYHPRRRASRLKRSGSRYVPRRASIAFELRNALRNALLPCTMPCTVQST